MAGTARFAGIIGVTFVVLAIPASAAEPMASGYWSQVPAGTTPEGGLEVAATGFDRIASSVAAVRATGDVSTITLVEASSTVPPGVDPVVIHACPVTSAWEPPEGRGASADAPTYDCAQQFDTLERVERDGEVLWIADVARFAVDGVVDIVLVTGPGRGPFTVSFQPPGADTVQVAEPEAASAPTPATVTAPPMPPRADVFSAPPAISYAAPALAPPSAAPIVEQASALDDGDVEVAVPASRRTATAPVDDATGGRTPLALVAVAVALGAWFWRYRVVQAEASAHPLAGSIASRVAAGFAGAGSVVAADNEPLDVTAAGT